MFIEGLDQWENAIVNDSEGFPIYEAAMDAINHARMEGQSSGKHPPDSWMEESIENQLDHASRHITNIYIPGYSTLEEAEHALCRLAIAIALYKKEQHD